MIFLFPGSQNNFVLFQIVIGNHLVKSLDSISVEICPALLNQPPGLSTRLDQTCHLENFECREPIFQVFKRDECPGDTAMVIPGGTASGDGAGRQQMFRDVACTEHIGRCLQGLNSGFPAVSE